ncbi:MAG: hypothetical protein E7127_00710 [Rikenellaceae bacterium]|nr:hypothetical protein [Rikenellaceae bacterium]
MNKDIKSVTIYDPPYNDQPVAIYVHGLASGANAATGKALSKRFNNFNWITTDFGEDLAANVRQLNKCVEEHKPQLIIGTSMGGLTLLYADAPNTVKIAINPALSIADCVRNTIGLGQHKYFCKRLDGATEFELTEEMCKGYEAYIATHTPSLGRASYAVFAAHDELLGDEASVVAQKVVGDCGYKVLVDPEGTHRIKPSTIDLIDNKIVSKEFHSNTK